MADRLVRIADDFWNIRGSFRVAKVVDIGTHCSLVRLQSGRFVLLDSYTLSDEVLAQVYELTDGGEAVEAIVNLHPFHTVHVRAAHGQFPAAKLYGTARHVEKRPELPWQDIRAEDPAMNQLFGGEFQFLVPAGVALVCADPKVHTGSVLALHRPSRTLHVDDTLSYSKLPLVGGLKFHLGLAKALEQRAGAAAEFRAWVEELLVVCEQVDHLCTAHTRPLPPVEGSAEVVAAVRGARDAVDRLLRKHEKTWG